MKPAVLCLLALSLSACAVGPDYSQPAFKHGEQWHGEVVANEVLQASVRSRLWWQQFDDPLLSEVIEKAAANNLELAVALANVERAKAIRQQAGAGLLPTLDATGEARRSRYSRQTGFGANTGTRNSFDASLDASWEIDLFGGTRRAMQAADARIDAVEAARQGVKLAVIAEVAASYFELRGLQRQLTLSRRNIELLEAVEAIAAAQAELGASSELDLLRARGERESVQAGLPDLEARMMARIFRISVLTGQAPEVYLATLAQEKPMPVIRDRVPVGLRSELLKRRPDLLQAERELATATANIGVVTADLYPGFSLTGSLGSSARLFSDLFTPATLTRSLAGLLNWPLFAGGALHAAVDVAKAEEKAALARYEQSILLALEDTESALITYAREWQTLQQLRAAEASRVEAFEISKLRYEAGEDSFLVILDAERSLMTTRNDIISSETRLLTTLTLLYKALGGDWQLPAAQ